MTLFMLVTLRLGLILEKLKIKEMLSLILFTLENQKAYLVLTAIFFPLSFSANSSGTQNVILPFPWNKIKP